MYKLPEQIANANKASIETLASLANTTFAGAERMAALNLNAVRGILEDSAASARAMIAAKDAADLASLQASLAQPGLEKAKVYSRRVYSIASETREALSEVIEAALTTAATPARAARKAA